MTKVLKQKIKRFLKKVRLIDIALMSLLLIIGVVVFALLFRKASYLTITVKIGEDSIVWPRTGIPSWYLNQLKEGMVEKDILGRPVVEIIDVYSYPSRPTDQFDIYYPSKKMLFLTMKIRAVSSKTTSSYVFNSKPVLVGNTIRVNPGNILVEGLITNIEGVPDTRERVKLTVETQVFDDSPKYPNTSGVDPFIANAVNRGDEVKDSTGKAVIRVVEKRVENAKRIVVTDTGRTFLTQDPFKKDLYLTLEIEATRIGNDYYLFDDIRLAIGTVIPIQLKNALIEATVTKIAE